MRMPRKAILIRLAIYVPLLSYFGWQAWQHLQAERAAGAPPEMEQAPGELADPFDGLPTKTIDVDGKKVKVYEITPEQAEAYLGVKPGDAPAAGSTGEAAPVPAQPDPGVETEDANDG